MSPGKTPKTKVLIARNFETNLERIERFLDGDEFEAARAGVAATQERIDRIEEKALSKLRERAGADPLPPLSLVSLTLRRGQVFDRLIDDLTDRVVPLLERTPRLGPPFAPSMLSHESRFVLERITARLGGRELRQLVRGDFLLLYLLSPRGVALLAIRHHREQGFNLATGR